MLNFSILTEILDEYSLFFAPVGNGVEVEGLVVLGYVALTPDPGGYRVEVDDLLALTSPLAWKVIGPWAQALLRTQADARNFALTMRRLNDEPG